MTTLETHLPESGQASTIHDIQDAIVPRCVLDLDGACNELATAYLATADRDSAASSTAVPSQLASESPSSPASTVWSDGDRERLPSTEILAGAAAVFARLASQGDEALRRPRKLDCTAAVLDVLCVLVEANGLPAHVLVCAVSIAARLALAAPKALNGVTAKRVVVACVVLAGKAESDEVHGLAYYGMHCGVAVDMLAATEAQIFQRLDYSVHTTAVRFHDALANIVLSAPTDATD